VAGRLLLVCRLLVRDMRRRRTETVLLLFAISAATGTLALGLALDGVADRPYQQTRAATAGPDMVIEPAQVTGPQALAALAPLTTAPGVTGHSGPYPVAYLTLTAHGKTVHAVVEGRDTAPAAIDRPAVTGGTWLRPGGAVVERAFADALGVRTGDTISVDGHALRVAGTAVTAARVPYPQAGWRVPGTPFTDPGGLVWVERGEIAALAGGQQALWYTLNVRLADPAAGDTIGAGTSVAIHTTTWQQIADADDRLVAQARKAMLIGSWLLAGLATAGVAGIVAGRIIGRRRRMGLLKAVGAGPGMIAAVQLAEYLVTGLAAAGIGLAAGWFAAPVLTGPGAGLTGSVGAHPPALRTVIAALVLALVIAGAAALAPVVRAATTDTVHALADAATPPLRRRWRVRLSRRLPAALMIGVRINARRPRRARLAMVNTLIITTTLAAALMFQAQDRKARFLGPSELPDPENERTYQAILIVTFVLCALALVNAIANTWTAVLDARRPLAVARTLGATPGQASAGLAAAQLLPSIPGVVAGIPAGILLYRLATPGAIRYPPGSWWLATALAVLFAMAALTVIPALAAARRPVADALRSTPS
jgi:putative ABC transport system permease protein